MFLRQSCKDTAEALRLGGQDCFHVPGLPALHGRTYRADSTANSPSNSIRTPPSGRSQLPARCGDQVPRHNTGVPSIRTMGAINECTSWPQSRAKAGQRRVCLGGRHIAPFMAFPTATGWWGCGGRRNHFSYRMRAIRLVHRRADKRVRIGDCDANTHSNCPCVIRVRRRECD